MGTTTTSLVTAKPQERSYCRYHGRYITELFCQVDDQTGYLPKHRQARLYPSEVVTLALFNILIQWHGFLPDDTGFAPLSIAEFSL